MDQIKYREIIDYAEKNIRKAIESIPPKLDSMETGFPVKLASAKLSPLNKLGRLYDAMESMHSHLSNFTACKAGCSNCCYYPVTISAVEIEYIEKNEGLKRSSIVIAKPSVEYRGIACSFLKAGKCSIYSSRPFACRNLVSIAESSTICDVKYAFDHELPILHFSGFSAAYDMVRVEAGCGDKLIDIREAFRSRRGI